MILLHNPENRPAVGCSNAGARDMRGLMCRFLEKTSDLDEEDAL